MKLVKVLTAFLLLAVTPGLANSAPAQGSDPFRPCQTQDLAGAWTMMGQMINMPADPKNDPYFFENQRYVFEAGGTVRHMTSNKPITAQEKKLQMTAPPTIQYALTQGKLLLTRKDIPGKETWLCTYIIESNPEIKSEKAPRRGDLLLTFGKPPSLQRLLRKEAANR